MLDVREEMKALNFKIKDHIYLVSEGVEHDVHNNFDFDVLEFDEKKKEAILSWISIDAPWNRNNPTERIELKIKNVSSIESSPPDPEADPSDDKTLEDFLFTCDEEWCDQPFSIESEPEESWGWVFDFSSGRSITVFADQIQMKTIPNKSVVTTPEAAPPTS